MVLSRAQQAKQGEQEEKGATANQASNERLVRDLTDGLQVSGRRNEEKRENLEKRKT